MISKQIEFEITKEITKLINELIDRYIEEGLSLYQMKKYFKSKHALNMLIKDINKIGERYFDNNNEYNTFIVKVLYDVLNDRVSEEETNKLQENTYVKKYSIFEYQKESIETKDISAEYLFNDIGITTDAIGVLSTYFKTDPEYIDALNVDYCVYSITDFKTDILKNNRTKLDVLLLDNKQVNKMKENILNKIISGLYNQINQEVTYMGIAINVHSVLDKQKIKDSINSIVEKNIIDIISNITKYNFIEKYNEEYYIWNNVK